MTSLVTQAETLAADEPWSPSAATRFWLLAGIAGLAVDLAVGIAIAVLEQQHWGQDGLTPDVWLNYASIAPQIGIVLAWLAVAREIGARGLWKSMAGMFAAYVLMQLVSLTLWELLPDAGNIGLTVAAGVGLVALAIFTFGPWPRFQHFGAEPAAAAESESSSGSSWGLHIIALLGVFLLRRALKGFGNLIPNFGLDGWALLELCVLGVFALGFATWFAAAKIRHREMLGTLAVVVGGAEFVILAIHAAMIGVLIWLVIAAVQANPQIDEDGWNELIDPWAHGGSLISSACHGIWCLLTAALFVTLWLRPEPDWRESFTSPTG
jgi:hypothetical protein